jgi:hypothetical protein
MLASTLHLPRSLRHLTAARPFGPLDDPEPEPEPKPEPKPEPSHDDSTPARPRYVDLDPLRGGGVFAEVLAAVHRFVAGGVHTAVQLLAGGGGTGKSTELRRLARALEHGEGLVGALGGERRIELRDLRDLRDAVVPLRVDLARHGAWMRAPTLDALQHKLAVELREAARLQLGRWELPACSDPHVVVAELVDQLAPRRLVLLVDHFDALAVPPWEVARAYEQLEGTLLGAARSFALSGCMALYAVADHVAIAHPDLALLGAEQAWFLPAVRLWNERGGLGVEDEAVRRLEQVVEGWVDLDLLFGPHRAELGRRLVILGGGNLGVLAQLVAEVLHLADDRYGLPVTALELMDAATRLRARMQLCTNTGELLACARQAGPQPFITRTEAGRFVAAMHHGAIQSYWGGWRGDALWQDVHPLVAPGRLWV